MVRRRRVMAVLLLAIAPLPRVAAAEEEGPEPVRYTLRFPRPAEHVVEVEADLPTGGGEALTVMMPVWTPGSYLVREFAGHLETIGASGPEGAALKVEKVAKNRWTVETGGAGRVVVRYALFARDPSVRTNWVDPAFALLNGASTYLTIADDEGTRPHEVLIEMPAGWPESVTTLEAIEGGPHRYRAESFDELVDAPIVLGNPAVYAFEVDGVPHRLVNVDEGGVWDGARSVADLEKVVAAARDVWGKLPYDEYVFFNILTGGGGGIEHRESTVMMADRWASRSDSSYLHWLDLAAHEHFHAWNVKRLRPAALGPFDYEEENHTRSLWVAEGITTYYSSLILRRAGLCTADQLLSGPGGFGLSTLIERLEETPGRLVQPLAEASFDAWIKFYRPGPNSRESTVSYYTKGAVVGFLLDAEIRRATGGSKSLDDLMRLAFERYSGAAGYTPEQFRALASEVAGADLSGFFARAVDSTEELDYGPALEWFGLRFKPAGDDDGPGAAWHGMDLGGSVVSRVPRGTPGAEAGFIAGDELLAIGDLRVDAGDWSRVDDRYRPNETVDVLLARRGRLIRLPLTFGRKPPGARPLERVPDASDAQKAHRAAWIGEEIGAEEPDSAAGSASDGSPSP